jgi:hypothetical protein
MKKCKICKKEITKWSILGYCKICSNKFAHKRGKTKHYCIICHKNEISLGTFLYGKQRCRQCAYEIDENPMKGKKRPDLTLRNQKRRKHLINHCIDCKKIIATQYTRCQECWYKFAVGKNATMFGRVATHGKRIKYKNILMRSTWEVAYAKWLDKNKIKWQYESKTFDLGNCTYTPDFYLPKINTYIEIKGYWRDDAQNKFNLFRKLYPKIKIDILNKIKLQSLKIL